MRIVRTLTLAVALALFAFPSSASAASDTAFLDFPYVDTVSAAAGAPAFAWLSRQGDRSMILFARAPSFSPTQLVSRSDVEGAPITDLRLSPDGRRIVYQTGAPKGDAAFNPAALLDPPQVELWLVGTASGERPLALGAGREPSFSADGRWLTFKRGADLWAVDLRRRAAKPQLFARGGGAWSQFAWTKAGDLLFVSDRRGYSFLGRWRPGVSHIEWLATGVDRIAMPVLSPREDAVAFLRLPGRKHSVTYDQTAAEPFTLAVLDLRSGAERTLWRTRAPALTLGMDDPEGALRWLSADRLAFYSEEDGWGRLYTVGSAGGEPRPITPANCMVAESAGEREQLLVIHNCADRDRRQIAMVDPASGAEQRFDAEEPVIAQAAVSGGYAAFVGAAPDHAPLVRIVELASMRTRLAEDYRNYAYRSSLTGPAPQVVQLTAADGTHFSGQLFSPGGTGPHPALIYVHGGPQRQMFPAFHYSGYYATDYAINRRLAEQGYAVLAINYRSGIGYGRAFRDAPGRAWRGASEYGDVLAAGRWLAAQPNVDRQRIGIWGGSYGGLLTGQALARNSDLFKAGVAIHGVFDWSWPSPIEGHLNPSRYFGVGDDNKAIALASSPVGALAGWRSPVLLISGDADMNVDVVETVDLAARLRDRGVEVRTLILPGEAHDFVRHSSWERMWQALDGFLLEKLPPPAH